MSDENKHALQTATLGAGCFWCVEAVYQQMPGVSSVRSGYMGGNSAKPTYREVCTGETGHAEVVQLRFDPEKVSYEQILEWFWKLHDPTTLNRQGADTGTQYRSAIFYHDETQRKIAGTSKTDAQKDFDNPIVTEISEAGTFYPAENYHQNYYRSNPGAPYCQMIIAPKLRKLTLE